MSFTPFRFVRETTAETAKAAKAAKVEGAAVELSQLSQLSQCPGDLAERAAIIEEGAKVPRAWAEGFASLEAAPVPAGVSVRDWRAMVDSAGRFLDAWGTKAEALGWSAAELFGLDPMAPLGRLDRRGAAFFLTRAEVLAITSVAITVRVGASIQNIRRRDGFTVPAWEIAR